MLRTMERPTKATFRPVRGRHLEHLLHPVHVAGETGDDDALLGTGEDLRQHRGDVPLAGDDAGHLGVG
jgi:hypothetical protein